MGGQHRHRFVVPDLYVDPAHPIEDVLPCRRDRAIVFGEGDQHLIRCADLFKEGASLLRDAILRLSVDGVDRHFEVVQVNKFDIGSRYVL